VVDKAKLHLPKRPQGAEVHINWHVRLRRYGMKPTDRQTRDGRRVGKTILSRPGGSSPPSSLILSMRSPRLVASRLRRAFLRPIPSLNDNQNSLTPVGVIFRVVAVDELSFDGPQYSLTTPVAAAGRPGAPPCGENLAGYAYDRILRVHVTLFRFDSLSQHGQALC
jgi:hypothetical protein